MQGIDLSRRFYTEIIRPWLDEVAPGLPHAAALVGYGSELLGFDDETSRDQNWGPRLQLVLAPADFRVHAIRLVDAFGTASPDRFLGEPISWRSRPNGPVAGAEAIGRMEHGLEIYTLTGLLEEVLAIRSTTLTTTQWLGLAEQRLLAFTAGAVFHDDSGELTEARRALSYFPDDVWFYRIACQWRRIAEEQAFVGRAGQVGDDLGSRVVAARLVRDVMRLAFLLERRYAPYSKWFGSAFARLPISQTLAPRLQEVLTAANWTARGEALAQAYMLLAGHQATHGIAPFEARLGPYFDRPFITINADDAVAAAQAAIADQAIRALPVIGGLDQITDLTPLVADPRAAQRVVDAALR